ncbi:MAG: hypothetical protein QGF00_29175, partial [Planctomycetota bacterium]|nr:hypothetical protein [Planctomycetota bacterium]
QQAAVEFNRSVHIGNGKSKMVVFQHGFSFSCWSEFWRGFCLVSGWTKGPRRGLAGRHDGESSHSEFSFAREYSIGK